MSAAPLALLFAACVVGEESATVTVTVTDAAGAPLAGVLVAAHPHLGNLRWRGPVLATGTTDAAGTATLAVPAGEEREVVLLATKPGFAPFGRGTPLAPGETHAVALTLGPPGTPRLRVTGPDGAPLTGATVRELGVAPAGGDPGGGASFWRRPAADGWAGDAVGFAAEPSAEDGLLSLPPVPAGAELLGTVTHPDFVPARFRLTANDGGASEPAAVRLEEGVRVTIRVRPDAAAPPAEPADVPKLFCNRIGDVFGPSSWLYEPLPLGPPDADGVRTASLVAAPGGYGVLRLWHPAARFTPHPADLELKLGEDRTFETVAVGVRPVRGRLIDEAGEPVSGGMIFLAYPDRAADAALGWRPVDPPPGTDSYGEEANAGWVYYTSYSGTTDAGGFYEMDAPVGPVQISGLRFGEGSVSGRGVALADVPPPVGGAVWALPDVRIDPATGPPGPVAGTVLNADGTPAVGAAVRLRGVLRSTGGFALTDAAGAFALSPESVPTAGQGGPVVEVFACDPRAPVSASADVDLSDPAARAGIVLRLEPHDPAGEHDLPPREDAESAGDVAAAVSRIDRPLPDFSNATAFNIPAPPTRDDLRGKIVLIDVWATWCGGCPAAFPKLEKVRELYDGEVVVLLVHDDSVVPETVGSFIGERDVTLPVLADGPDGAITRGLRAGGGRPVYLLAGRDGVIRRTDRDGAGRLSNYLLENVRAAVLKTE